MQSFGQLFVCIFSHYGGRRGGETLTEDFRVNEQCGQVLARLVMEFERKATAFLFLGLDDQHRLLPTCRLQAVKHLIESLRQFTNFRIEWAGMSACRRFASTHSPDSREQAKQWTETGTQQQHVYQ